MSLKLKRAGLCITSILIALVMCLLFAPQLPVNADTTSRRYDYVAKDGIEYTVVIEDTYNENHELIESHVIDCYASRVQNNLATKLTFGRVTYNGQNLDVAVGSGLCRNNDKITQIVLNEGVKEVRDEAFYGCISITSVNFPSTLKGIGSKAFFGCTLLPTVDLSNTKLTASLLGTQAFSGCIALQNVSLPDYMEFTRIPSEWFSDCTMLPSITIPNCVVTIDEGAFSGDTALTDIVFGQNPHLSTIGDEVFSGCTALEVITFPTSLNVIGDYVFANCDKIAEINILDGTNIQEIGAYAFSNTKITEFTIPSSSTLVVLRKGTFKDCKLLESVTLNTNTIETFSDECFYSG